MNPRRSMVISIIGRPNVGKSSLFNRLLKKQHKSITHDMPGVTRDRHYGLAYFNDAPEGEECEAIMVDTGGFYPQKIDENVPRKHDQEMNKFFNIMTEHAKIAIDESDLILFVVDVREGLIPFDETITRYLRSTRKEFWLLINKFDSEGQNGHEADFYSLGIEPEAMFNVSAAHGYGVHELRAKIHEKILKFNEAQASEQGRLQKGVTPRSEVIGKLAIIGAPNAGKSTLLNQLIGSERALVSDIAGTTVDPIEGFFDLYFGKDAALLGDEKELIRNDSGLIAEYKNFRKNNPDVFKSIQKAYAEEEDERNAQRLLNEIEEIESETEEEAHEGTFEETQEESSEPLYEEGEIYAVQETEKLSEEREAELEHQVFEEEVQEDPVQNIDTKSDKYEGSLWRSLHLVDTAGIRKQKNIKGFIESQAVYRALRCIDEADIVIYMVDATIGIGHQDRRLLDIALEKGKSVIVCLNKIDQFKDVMKDKVRRKEWLEDLADSIPWLSFCDLIPLSAKTGNRLGKLKEAIKKTALIRRRSIPTGELNRAILSLVERHSIIPDGSSTRFRVKYATMIKSAPPTFLLFVNKSQGINDVYRRYLQNGIREYFGLHNTPIHLIFRTGKDLEKRMKKVE